MKKIVVQIILFVICLISTSLLATMPSTFEIKHHYVSPRVMGMGGAFSPLADDYNAIFYNPAGLAGRKDGQINFGLGGQLGSGLLDFKDDIDQNKSSGDENVDIQNMVDLLSRNYGRQFSVRAPFLGFSWVRPKWGIAILPADVSINMSMHQSIGPAINVELLNDTTLAFGYGNKTHVLGQELHWGVTGKYIYRIYYNDTIFAADLVAGSGQKVFKESLAQEGGTLDFDLGLLWTPDLYYFLQPTFSLVVRNLLDYGFTMNQEILAGSGEKPPTLQRVVDAGARISVENFWGFHPRFLIDLRDMGHTNFSFKKGLHLGAELEWALWSMLKGALRAGINQGYVTAGLSAHILAITIDFATYGEEVGTSDISKEDRRYIARLALDF
ncbi:MAG: conjugal transfer protein TraF [Bdellovibrionales bacterium]|jgi:hypothetical protein|nr:conjugal transfer protein TraF [Bdellovibrionales bacterium]MBT3525052.1 conjugal transfer protein TraF [Bdellovibrionales bacterium]MBT7766500.1 conjugal transfer protein TraF [Bdellovibrionales bacterium]